MEDKNNKGEYLYESLALNKILIEYKEVLHNTQIKKEAFEKGVRWLYENLFELPHPTIFYINSPNEGTKVSKSSKQINRLAFKNKLDQYLGDFIHNKGVRIDHIFLKSILLENLYISHDETVEDLINMFRKHSINMKKELERLAYIDYFRRLGDFNFPDFPYLKNLYCSGVSHLFLRKDCVFAMTAPTIREDENKQLHSAFYPAIEWPQGPRAYYVHGREMPDWVFTEYGTKKLYRRFLTEENENIRAGIITIIKERDGDRGFLDFLNAELVDEKEIQHFSGYKEILRLYKTKEKYDYLQDRHGKSRQPYCWSEFTCPSTGSTYLIDNSADFTDAIKAAKFLRPEFVSTNLTYKWSNDAC